jgi:hypothetical protein
MSIFYIAGKPGGGKSYLAVYQICEELKSGKGRNIVTNIQLNMAELAAWCHENIKEEVNLSERIRILDDEETGEFWLYEPHRKFEKRRVLRFGKREMEVPDFEDRGMPGTLYVIDEVHIYFGAREWQATGSDCTYFLTQHRKMACDVILVTQHPEQTDKALRRLAQEYMVVRNLSREPVFGFRIANYFRFLRMLNSPQSPNPGTFDSGFIKLKPEVYGKLYDTTAGVGIAGRVSPTVEARGIHFYWLAVPACVVIVLFVWLATHLSTVQNFMQDRFKRAFLGVAHTAENHAAINIPKTTTVNDFVNRWKGAIGNAGANSHSPPDSRYANQITNDVYCTGYFVFEGKSMVFLSDGRIARSDYKDVQYIRPERVGVFNQVFDVHTTSQIERDNPSMYYQSSGVLSPFAGIVKNPVASSVSDVITMRDSGIPSSKPYTPHARPISFGQGSNPSQQSPPFSSSVPPSQGNP